MGPTRRPGGRSPAGDHEARGHEPVGRHRLWHHGRGLSRRRHETFWPIKQKPKVTSTGVVCKTKNDCKRAFGSTPVPGRSGRPNSGRRTTRPWSRPLAADEEVRRHRGVVPLRRRRPDRRDPLPTDVHREPGIDIQRSTSQAAHQLRRGPCRISTSSPRRSTVSCPPPEEGFGLTLAKRPPAVS